MFNKIFNLIVLVTLISISSVTYATYKIAPIKVKLSKVEKITSLNLTNNYNVDKSFQVTILKIDKTKSNKTYVPSKDIIASPVIFKAAAGQNQIIRLAIINPDAESKVDDYRVSIKELPQGRNIGNVVNIITEFSLPISIGV